MMQAFVSTDCDGAVCICSDPLAPTGTVVTSVPSSFPPADGALGGAQIRLVFNKLLNNSIEKITIDQNKLPGQNETFELNAGIVELVDSTGKEVPSFKYWDPTGSPGFSSDALNLPFGPAIVVKPLDPLLSSADYKIVVHTGTIQDRSGNPMADQNGSVLSGDLTVPFHTATLMPNAAAATTPDLTSMPKIATDSVLQLSFNTQVAIPATTVFALMAPTGATVKLFAYYDRYLNGADCVVNKTTIDLVPIDPTKTTPTPVAWPAGAYTLVVGTEDTMGTPLTGITGLNMAAGDVYASDPKKPFAFTVDPMAKTGADNNPSSIANHPIDMCPAASM
jgi:hypothetical protein